MCWCSDQGRGASSCQRHGTTLSWAIPRPHWDVGTWGLIVFNFSIGDRSRHTTCEKLCEILLLEVQWKVLREGWTNRLSGSRQGILARLSQTREAVWLSDDTDLRDLRFSLVLHRLVPAFGKLPSLCPLRNSHFIDRKKCLIKATQGGIYTALFSSVRLRTLASIWASTLGILLYYTDITNPCSMGISCLLLAALCTAIPTGNCSGISVEDLTTPDFLFFKNTTDWFLLRHTLPDYAISS